MGTGKKIELPSAFLGDKLKDKKGKIWEVQRICNVNMLTLSHAGRIAKTVIVGKQDLTGWSNVK